MKTADFFLNINSWEDFQNAILSLNNKEKGDIFELLVKLYFKLSPKFSFYDEVWLLSEVPINVLEELEIPGHDLGIDLVAQTGNEYHPIQCKFHSDTDQSVTFKEVSTFISMLASNDKFAQGYICSTADLTSRNYNKLKTKPINLLLLDSWQELGQEFFDNVRNYFAKKKLKLEPYQPREHQKKALADAKDYFIKQGNSRGKLIFPCGAGKSLTGFWMMKELKSRSTLIAVPSLSLVKQTLDVYLREIVAHKQHVKWLCICSDEGIGTGDDVVFYTENLGVPCQTDPNYIENWMQEHNDNELIVFTTYQSGRIIGEISKKLNFTFDLGIFDEAHKTVGSDKKLFSHLLFDENISVGKRIFMTATERFYRGSKDDIISMDDYDMYGETFTQMSFKEAIDLGLLTDYKVITIEVKKSEIADFIKQNSSVQLSDAWKKETEARSLASMLALRKAMKLFPIKNAVSFHSSIEKATRNKELQQYITDTYHYDSIDTFTVSGKLPTTKRNVIVQEFAKSPKSLITNARCLTEGVDVPNIDCIVFSDPRKSKVDIVQALGRALRRKEGKDWGYVILPVIYDAETHEIDNENFQEILSIVRGLASNDERIVEYFKERAEQGKSKAKREKQFHLEVFSELMEETELSSQLEIRLWERLSRFNWMPFEEARAISRSFNLKKQSEWNEFIKNNPIMGIPVAPWITYRNKGWKSLGDWLGRTPDWDGKWIPFEEAREFVRNLELKNNKEWRKYSQTEKPFNIPSKPDQTYKDWQGWGDWLGYIDHSPKFKNYLDYEKAKALIQKYNVRSFKEWNLFIKKEEFPSNALPKTPNNYYKNLGWINWGDFLGTKVLSRVNRTYMSFEEAKIFVKKLNLKSSLEYRKYCKGEFSELPKKPDNLPVAVQEIYSDSGWSGFKDFLGYKTIKKPLLKVFLSYSEAKEKIMEFEIRSNKEWRKFTKLSSFPANVPKAPDKIYKISGEWQGWSDFFGSSYATKQNIWPNFEDLKTVVREMGIKSSKDYKNLKRQEWPTHPDRVYKTKWNGWRDFLES